MKPREMGKIEKRFFRIVLVIIGILLLVILFGPDANAQTPHLRYHNKLQKERSFESWRKSQPKIRVNAVKSAVKQSKSIRGNNNQSARLVRKENRVRKSIIK
jgi:hypothetical protein